MITAAVILKLALTAFVGSITGRCLAAWDLGFEGPVFVIVSLILTLVVVFLPLSFFGG